MDQSASRASGSARGAELREALTDAASWAAATTKDVADYLTGFCSSLFQATESNVQEDSQ